jgi:hypothetical protein
MEMREKRDRKGKKGKPRLRGKKSFNHCNQKVRKKDKGSINEG